MSCVYPTIFTETETGYLVEVPDLEILTEGTDIENAVCMARDAISLTIVSMQEHNEEIPLPSEFEEIDITKGTFFGNGKSFVSLVDADISSYRQAIDQRPVRRNVSLPNWLNCEVNKAGINVSRFLQEALVEKLNIHR